MDKDDCVVYSGEFFTVEWYFDETGKSQPYEFFEESTNQQKRKFLMLVQRICDFGKIVDKTKFRNEGDGIYAFKPQPDRFLSFFVKSKKIIIPNAFKKKTQKIPENEKRTALKLKDDYLKRNS